MRVLLPVLGRGLDVVLAGAAVEERRSKREALLEAADLELFAVGLLGSACCASCRGWSEVERGCC